MAITYHAGRRVQGLSTEGITTPTYEDDFSSYADQTAADAVWVSNDTGDFRVNVTNDNLAYDSKVTGTTNQGIYYDFGTALSDTAWVLDFKMVISTLTLYSSGSVGAATYITMNNSGTGGAIGGSVDAIGFYMSSTATGGRFTMTNADSGPLNIAGGTLNTINATGTYYVRIIRLSSTSMRLELYNDPARTASSLIEGQTKTGISSGITGLKYFRLQDNQSSAGTGTGQNIGTIDDIKIYNGVTTATTVVQRPTNVQEGSRYEETDTRKIYYKFDANTYHSEVWYEDGIVPYAGGRGVFGSGYASTYDDTMDYITIATLGDATDFGDISVARLYLQAVSSRTRGIFGGGHTGSNSDVLDYITFATPSNATDFGNLTAARHATGGVSSGTRGVFGGGTTTTTVTTMDYITIDTRGNADTFGNLSVARQDLKGVSSDTRGIFGGGSGGTGNGDYMDYITIGANPTVTATDFGDLLMLRRYPAGLSNGTRGIFAGGDSGSNEISMDYITIDANPTVTAGDFGDLSVARHAPAGVSSDTRGVIGGGNSGSISDVMDYITFATLGDATPFGDLTVARNHLAGASRF